MGHRQGPEEPAQPLDVSAVLQGLADCCHLVGGPHTYYNIPTYVENYPSTVFTHIYIAKYTLTFYLQYSAIEMKD
jgi:hypothetical protein